MSGAGLTLGALGASLALHVGGVVVSLAFCSRVPAGEVTDRDAMLVDLVTVAPRAELEPEPEPKQEPKDEAKIVESQVSPAAPPPPPPPPLFVAAIPTLTSDTSADDPYAQVDGGGADGVEAGAAGGVEAGVAGGVKGGVPRGTKTGVVGGVASVAARKPLPIIGPSYNAAYLHNTPPAYPAMARRNGLQGRAIIRVLVGLDGHPQRVRLQTSSGTSILDDAAIEAVQLWTFVPARQGTMAIAAEVDVPLVFRLEGTGSE